jgi:hypothetical protein
MPTTSAKRAAANLAAAIEAGKQGARRALPGIGERMRADVQASLASPAAPSAPGSPPARRTGGLQISYKTALGKGRRGDPYVAVYSTHRAASMLEHGTSEMAARPALRPAVNRQRPTITPTFKQAWEAAQRSRGR